MWCQRSRNQGGEPPRGRTDPLHGGGTRLSRRVPAILLGLLILALGAGCAPSAHRLVRPALENLPPGSPLRITTLPVGDAWVRHHLMLGEHDQALGILALGTGDSSDRLLRSLQEALVLRQAGAFGRSNHLLEWADQEAERRFVRSLSRTAASLVLNDRVLPFTPGPGEMAMIPYFRMMNYLALGERDGATVEARRITSILARDPGDSAHRCRERGMLQYLAGLTFEGSGELNDALVSLRNAEASFGSCGRNSDAALPEAFGADLYRVARRLGIDEVADSALARYPTASVDAPAGSGGLVVLLEHGFIAHRTEEALHVPIFPDDIEGLESGETEAIAAAAGRVAARLSNNFAERGYWGASSDDPTWVQVGHALAGGYVLRLAWPAYREVRRETRPLRLWVGGEPPAELITVGDLSAVVRTELEDSRREMIPRLVARGLARYLIAREMEKKAEEKGGDFVGFITGRAANLAANELERADTRSWTLLPDQLMMARLTLPAGNYDLRLEAVSASGETLGWIDLEEVEVRAGEVRVVSQRLWQEGDRASESSSPDPAW